MATEKKLKTRTQQKTDTLANWEKATNFIPLKGEQCIYSDINRMKVGDGVTLLSKLPFFDSGIYKSYTGIIATSSSSQDVMTFYFGEVIPTDLNVNWTIHYQIYVTIPGQVNYQTFCDVTMIGTASSIVSYASFNGIKNTSYRPIYYSSVRYVNTTGFAAGHGHLIGVNLQNSNNPTNASYKRNLEVRLIETKNCTMSLFDSVSLYANISWYNSGKSYAGQYNIDACNNGLRETGDDNDVSNLYDYGAYRTDES